MDSHSRASRAIRGGLRGLAALAAGLLLSGSAQAQAQAPAPATVRDLLSHVLHQRPGESYFVIPAAGHVIGVNGNEFRTDVTISAAAPTRVAVAWLAQNADNSSRPLSFFDVGPRPAFFEDMVESALHETGLGALVVAAIAPDGGVDVAARISGFGRIWTAAAGCAGSSSLAVRPVRFANASSGYGVSAYGIRLDESHRANLGIVNPNPDAVVVQARAASAELAISVPPFSMRQVSIPAPADASPDGTIGVTLLGAPAGAFFTGYAVSVDQVSGDGWLVTASD